MDPIGAGKWRLITESVYKPFVGSSTIYKPNCSPTMFHINVDPLIIEPKSQNEEDFTSITHYSCNML